MGIVIKDILAVMPGGKGRKCSLYIDNGNILSLDTQPPGFSADRVIDGEGKLLTPGLVNAHTHAYMSVFRNWADDLDFKSWLFKKIMPMEEALTGEDAYWASMLSCMEMIKGGMQQRDEA